MLNRKFDPDSIRSVDPDPDSESGSGFGIRIRIQGGKNDPLKEEKIKKFHVLKSRMFSFEG